VTELEGRQGSAPDGYQVEAALGLAAAGLGRAADALRHAERAVERPAFREHVARWSAQKGAALLGSDVASARE
jgi:hypothetical protein